MHGDIRNYLILGQWLHWIHEYVVAEENKQYHEIRHHDRTLSLAHFNDYARLRYSETDMWGNHDRGIIMLMREGWPHNESFYKRTYYWGYRNTGIMLVVQWSGYIPNDATPENRAAIDALTNTDTYLDVDFDSDGGTDFQSNSS